MHSDIVTLTAQTPFSLKTTVLSHGWHECSPMSWCEGGKCFQLVGRIAGSAARISVTESRRAKKTVTLKASIEAEQIDAQDVERITLDLKSILDLDRDLSEFYAVCQDHPTLYVLPAIGAGRLLRSASMTENILKALCATNVNWTQAVKMINRLGQLGPPLRHFVHLNAWPTPREILRAGEPYLLEVCRLGYRASSILRFCRDVCDGRIIPDQLYELIRLDSDSSDEILAQLRSIHGIGPSSAYFLLSLLRRHEKLAIDSATVAHVRKNYLLKKKPTFRQIERIYARYGKWRNLVSWWENWLTWDTAKTILREAGLTPGNIDRDRFDARLSAG